ncbi:MAG: PAS domain S-box protein [bacterium]
MRDKDKTKEQLIKELEGLRQRICELESSEKVWKRSKKEIRNLSSAVAQSIDGIAIINLDLEFVYINDAFAGMHGYSHPEMIGLGQKQLRKVVQMETIGSRLDEIKTLGSWKGESNHIRKDGTLFPVFMSITLLKDEAGKPTGIIAIFRDITEQKQIQDRLQESEEKYKCLFENANDAIFIADTTNGIILDANKKAEQLLGRPRQEIIGIHQSRLHPQSQDDYYKYKFRKHIQKGQIFDLEAEIIKKDGSIVPVFISANVITLKGKEVIQGLFRDISLDKRILELKEEIVARKLIDKAKRVLMNRFKISEQEAMRQLQKESRRQRKKIKEIAQAVISTESFF